MVECNPKNTEIHTFRLLSHCVDIILIIAILLFAIPAANKQANANSSVDIKLNNSSEEEV